jgi:hypothetical protein
MNVAVRAGLFALAFFEDDEEEETLATEGTEDAEDVKRSTNFNSAKKKMVRQRFARHTLRTNH